MTKTAHKDRDKGFAREYAMLDYLLPGIAPWLVCDAPNDHCGKRSSKVASSLDFSSAARQFVIAILILRRNHAILNWYSYRAKLCDGLASQKALLAASDSIASCTSGQSRAKVPKCN